MATEPFFLRALVKETWFASIVSTIPIYKFSFEGIQRGVPTLRIPPIMSTPRINGFFLLNTSTCFKIQGNVAKWPSSFFFNSFISLTLFINPSNKW